MNGTIEVTQAMVDAGVAAINELRMAELAVRKRETVEMSWADVLSVAYAAMEERRRQDQQAARVVGELHGVRTVGTA